MSGEKAPTMGSVEDILAAAVSDYTEETLEVPEWGCTVKVCSLSARQSAEIKQVGIKLRGKDTSVIFVEMEKRQFLHGVIEPKFSEQQVNQLFQTGGGDGWSRIIGWLDEHSGTSAKERQKAAAAFPDA